MELFDPETFLWTAPVVGKADEGQLPGGWSIDCGELAKGLELAVPEREMPPAETTSEMEAKRRWGEVVTIQRSRRVEVGRNSTEIESVRSSSSSVRRSSSRRGG